jgi:hypothetical protein
MTLKSDLVGLTSMSADGEDDDRHHQRQADECGDCQSFDDEHGKSAGDTAETGPTVAASAAHFFR